MSTTNIDRSLDDIIKEQRKLKKKAQKAKTQQQLPRKGTQQRQGKKQVNQKQGKRVAVKQNNWQRQQGSGQGAQGRKRGLTRKQNNQSAQQRKGAQVNQSGPKGINRRRQNAGGPNKGTGGPRAAANRLKSKQGIIQKGKRILSKAKQVQLNRLPLNRQNRQTQQKDARLNILNKRRGLQGPVKGKRPNKAQNADTSKLQRINRRGNASPQLTVSINNPRVRITRTPQWEQVTNQLTNQSRSRRWRGNKASVDTGDLRISVPNNLHQPLKTLYAAGFKSHTEDSAFGKTFATLDERFSSIPQTRRVGTIFID